MVNLLITKVNPADPPFRLRSLLNDGDPGVAARNHSAVDGLRLIDGQAGKLYIPATTGDGICLCSPASNTVFDKLRRGRRIGRLRGASGRGEEGRCADSGVWNGSQCPSSLRRQTAA